MKYFCFACLLLASSALQATTVLTFEDLTLANANFIEHVAPGYGGLTWENVGVVDKNYRPDTGYESGAVSGDYTAFNGAGESPTNIDLINSSQTMTFTGAYFSSAWSTQIISFLGYSNGVLVEESGNYWVTTSGPLWIELNWSSIDSLQIVNSGSQWVMDDFTYSVVPIPAAVWLFGSALAGLGWIRKK
jgi:hypothetical protein